MSDIIDSPVTQAAPVVAQETPTAVAPAPSIDNSTVPVSAPSTEAVAAPEATAVEVKAPEAKQTLLGEGLDKTVQPPEVKETKETEQGGQSEEPAPPPTYEAFKAPEGLSLDDSSVSQFTGILADLETKGKVDHTLVQEFGQKAVDFYIEQTQKTTQALNDYYQETWEKQKLEWKDKFLSDPEIGGNRFQNTVDSALGFIRTHGGTSEQQAEFKGLMESSGLGNHPVMIRLLANAGRAMSEGQPLANVKPVSAPKSKTATLYGNSN